MSHRLSRLRALLAREDLDATLICTPENRRYYSGFTGTTGHVLVTPDEAFFLADFRYVQQAARECPGFTILSVTEGSGLFSTLRERKLRRLAVEEDFVSLALARRLEEEGGVRRLTDAGPEIRADRMCKDAEEVSHIRQACALTDLAFEHILGFLREGLSEAKVDFELRKFLLGQSGVEKTADRFIVASGERGSMPHGVASEKKLRRGEFVTMDFGCNYKGYWSDLTRTVCLGRADGKQREIYQSVLWAQQLAAETLRPGITGRTVDTVARDSIGQSGYGAYFGHGLGHSFGLEIHEAPRCAQNAEGDVPLQPGVIMTLEPGIYIEGWGGVRIEDDFVVTEEGCEYLSHCDRGLIEL